jgi:2-polyprenyl-6-methoxyphenol hydroxylase-like FAD-dependent oxidoreductase
LDSFTYERIFGILSGTFHYTAFLVAYMASPIKVLIVGGSITGLSLAMMLERNGIDFLLLEAHVDIAPEVGASIGLSPNGLRILDQLGCYDSLLEKINNHRVGTTWYGTLDGQRLREFEGLGVAAIERFVQIVS